MASGITIIEVGNLVGLYGMTMMEAIIDHPQEGRLYIAQGFGGIDSLEGGAYRWRHGLACRVSETDTLYTMDAGANGQATIRERMTSYMDPDRPVMEWSGRMIAAVAEAAGF